MNVREDVYAHAQKMWQAGLVVGSSGNVSRRVDAAHIAITPTAVSYDAMVADQICIVELATGRAIDTNQPSNELPMHLVIYRERPEVQAIVHTHAPYVTTLSVLRRALPPVIDEMMVYLGGTIEVADYAFTGTEEVGRNIVRALGDRAGVIVANHGNVCVGGDLAQALQVALAMEAAARVYVQALQIGDPVPLPETSITAGRRMYDKRY